MNALQRRSPTSAGDASQTLPERPVLVRPARALTKQDLKLIRLPERFWNSTFDGISDGKHKRIVTRYVNGIHEMMSKGIGLILWGENNTGKTSIAAVIAKQARRHGYTVLFVRAAELLRNDLNRLWFDETRTKTWYQRAIDVDLLILDDMGKEHHAGSGYQAGYATDMLEDIVRARSSKLRSMVVTTNMSPSAIKDSTDDALYKRSMSEVMKGSTFPVRVDGPDRRALEMKKMQELLAE